MFTREEIWLQDLATVKKFVKFANKFDFEIVIIADNYIINGKSIMGLFGLDLSRPLLIEVSTEFPEEFFKGLEAFCEKKSYTNLEKWG